MTDESSRANIDRYQMIYDELNRIDVVKEWIEGESSPTRKTTYAYGVNGNPTKRTFDGENETEIAKYTYTERNLVEEITIKEGSDDADPQVTTYEYTPNGKRKQVTKPNGNITTYNYYLDQLLQKKVTKKSPGRLRARTTTRHGANGCPW